MMKYCGICSCARVICLLIVSIVSDIQCRFGPTMLEKLLDLYRRKIADSDDVMILREIVCPRLITDCVGKWVLLNDREDEGLVEDVDVSKNQLVILFGDVEDAEEYEIPFSSPDIVTWYKMSSKEEQEKEEYAATVIQRAIRYRLSKRFFFNRPVSRRQLSNSSSHSVKSESMSKSHKKYRKCVKPKLSASKGYYIESPALPNQKGLVDMYDLGQSLIRVVYDEDEFLLEKVFRYDDTEIAWYKKGGSEKQLHQDSDLIGCEATEETSAAALKLQANYRGM